VIGERRHRGPAVEAEHEFDGRIAGPLAAVGEGVRADLGDRALEQHHVRLVEAAGAAVSQFVDGVVEDVERGFEVGQRGSEFKWLVELRSQ
jgi:hypothetical protein